jgi:hypothetical protein
VFAIIIRIYILMALYKAVQAAGELARQKEDAGVQLQP